MSQQSSQESNHNDQKSVEPAIPFWKVVLSVVQASFGVQNKKNRERDFKHGKALPFIVAALIFTTLFVLALVFIVKMVLGTA